MSDDGTIGAKYLVALYGNDGGRGVPVHVRSKVLSRTLGIERALESTLPRAFLCHRQDLRKIRILGWSKYHAAKLYGL